MVLPLKPKGADQLDEERLASHVTREALIGVAEVRLPAGG